MDFLIVLCVPLLAVGLLAVMYLLIFERGEL